MYNVNTRCPWVVSRSGQGDFEEAGKECPMTASRSIISEAVHTVDDLVHCDWWTTEDKLAVLAGITHGSIHTTLRSNWQLSRRLSTCGCARNIWRDSKKVTSFCCVMQEMNTSVTITTLILLREHAMEAHNTTSTKEVYLQVSALSQEDMLIFFFDYCGYLLNEFLSYGATINAKYYQSIWQTLKPRSGKTEVDPWLVVSSCLTMADLMWLIQWRS